MKYKVIGTPQIETEYNDDEYQTVMSVELCREDGVTDTVWVVAGVPRHLQGTSKAARTQYGYQSVEVYGESVDHWCGEAFQVTDEDDSYATVARDVIEACRTVALIAHRERITAQET